MQWTLMKLISFTSRLFSFFFTNPTTPTLLEHIAGAPSVAKHTSSSHCKPCFFMQFPKARNTSHPVVVLFSGINSTNFSVTFRLQSTPLMISAHCAVPDTSVLSSKAIENASKFFAVASDCFSTSAANSVTLVATVLGDKLMPSNSFFWLGHKISLVFKRHSFMNKPSVKGRDDLAIISLKQRHIQKFFRLCLHLQRSFAAKSLNVTNQITICLYVQRLRYRSD